MRIAIAIPEELVTPEILNAALEVNTRVDQEQIRRGLVPMFRDAVAGGKVRWQPEPQWGEERFDHAGTVLGRGWGDCDDIGPWEAASMRESGEDPGASSIVIPSGPKTFHAVVKQSDRQIRDPSQEAGMKVVGGVRPAVVRPLVQTGRPSVAVLPVDGGWRARADLPWLRGVAGLSLAGYGVGTSPGVAMREAITGVCGAGATAGVADRTQCANLLGLELLLRGVPQGQLETIFAAQGERFSPQQQQTVGDLFAAMVDALPGLVTISHRAAWGVSGGAGRPLLVRL